MEEERKPEEPFKKPEEEKEEPLAEKKVEIIEEKEEEMPLEETEEVEEKEEEEKEPLPEKKEEEGIEEKPIEEEKKEEEKPEEEETVTISPVGIWQILTAVFAILLIISIFTYGFRGAPAVTGATVEEPEAEPEEEPETPPTPLEDVDRVEVGVDDDAQKGPDTAKVTIIEFSDFQCPFCSRAAPTMEQILETYGDDVRLVFRDFPLSFHQNAQKAAEAAECAHEQGKFWEYHDKLFENQQALDEESLKKYADELGLDTAKFDDCLDSGKYEQEVKDDFTDGQKAGVRGTPAFFINGRLVSGAQPFENFKKVIDEELAK